LPRKIVDKSKTKSFENGFELREIKPLTDNQKEVFDQYSQGKQLMLTGMAGTGKTFIALYLAFKDLIEGKLSSIEIVRSTVPSRDMGFLPGTLQEKLAAYEDPYRQVVNSLFGRDDAWAILHKKGYVNMVSTSYLRGVTYKNVAIIFDEIQNCTMQELDTVITRVGPGCRVILCGDIKQNDLITGKSASGMPSFEKVIYSMQEFESVEFDIKDIVRSGLVKSYLLAKHRLGL
jgi:phosphate starvation-inducible protein PhoH